MSEIGQGSVRRRARRRVLYVNEVDLRLSDQGIPTSLEEQVSDQERQDAADKAHIVGEADQSNTQRLKENVPPHAQARIYALSLDIKTVVATKWLPPP